MQQSPFLQSRVFQGATSPLSSFEGTERELPSAGRSKSALHFLAEGHQWLLIGVLERRLQEKGTQSQQNNLMQIGPPVSQRERQSL